jgi:hypothetical protein
VARMGEGETCTGFWREGPKERDHTEDPGLDGRMGSEWIIGRLAGGGWSGFSWLRIGTVDGLLWTGCWTFGFWSHGVNLGAADCLSQSMLLLWCTSKEDSSSDIRWHLLFPCGFETENKGPVTRAPRQSITSDKKDDLVRTDWS